MKKLLILSFVALFPLLATAQKNEGSILYTTKMKLKLGGEIAKMLSEQQLAKLQNRTTKKQLFFNANESVYQNPVKPAKEEQPNEHNFSTEGGGIQIKIADGSANNDQLYYNIAAAQEVDMRTFMGKRFLIKDAPKKRQWKLTAENKKILGYECRRATIKTPELEAEAWFTMQIPVSSGPRGYGQLPGMILELSSISIRDGKRSEPSTTTATKIELKKLEKGTIKAPRKGKKVNRKQFDKIQKRKLAEMRELQKNKGGNMIIERH